MSEFSKELEHTGAIIEDEQRTALEKLSSVMARAERVISPPEKEGIPLSIRGDIREVNAALETLSTTLWKIEKMRH